MTPVTSPPERPAPPDAPGSSSRVPPAGLQTSTAPEVEWETRACGTVRGAQREEYRNLYKQLHADLRPGGPRDARAAVARFLDRLSAWTWQTRDDGEAASGLLAFARETLPAKLAAARNLSETASKGVVAWAPPPEVVAVRRALSPVGSSPGVPVVVMPAPEGPAKMEPFELPGDAPRPDPVAADLVLHLALPRDARELAWRDAHVTPAVPGRGATRSVLVFTNGTFEEWWARQLVLAARALRRQAQYGVAETLPPLAKHPVAAVPVDVIARHLRGWNRPVPAVGDRAPAAGVDQVGLAPDRVPLGQARAGNADPALELTEYDKAKEHATLAHGLPEIRSRVRDAFKGGLPPGELLVVARLYQYQLRHGYSIPARILQRFCQEATKQVGLPGGKTAPVERHARGLEAKLATHKFISHRPGDDTYTLSKRAHLLGLALARCVDGSLEKFDGPEYQRHFEQMETTLASWADALEAVQTARDLFAFWNDHFELERPAVTRPGQVLATLAGFGDVMDEIIHEVTSKLGQHQKNLILVLHGRHAANEFEAALGADVREFQKRLNVYDDKFQGVETFKQAVQGHLDAIGRTLDRIMDECARVAREIANSPDFVAGIPGTAGQQDPATVASHRLRSVKDCCSSAQALTFHLADTVQAIFSARFAHLHHLLDTLASLRRESSFSRKLFGIWKTHVHQALADPESYRAEFASLPLYTESITLVNPEIEEGVCLADFEGVSDVTPPVDEVREKIRQREDTLAQERRDAKKETERLERYYAAILGLANTVRAALETLDPGQRVSVPEFIHEHVTNAPILAEFPEKDPGAVFVEVYQEVAYELDPRRLHVSPDVGHETPPLLTGAGKCPAHLRMAGPCYEKPNDPPYDPPNDPRDESRGTTSRARQR